MLDQREVHLYITAKLSRPYDSASMIVKFFTKLRGSRLIMPDRIGFLTERYSP